MRTTIEHMLKCVHLAIGNKIHARTNTQFLFENIGFTTWSTEMPTHVIFPNFQK